MTSTLLDNIFVGDPESISDHLPVFAIKKNFFNNRTNSDTIVIRFRDHSDDAMKLL